MNNVKYLNAKQLDTVLANNAYGNVTLINGVHYYWDYSETGATRRVYRKIVNIAPELVAVCHNIK